MAKYKERLIDFQNYLKEIEHLNYSVNTIVYWDKLKAMPMGGEEYHNEVMIYLLNELRQKKVSEKFKSFIKYFENNKQNSQITDACVNNIIRSRLFIEKIPTKEYREYLVAINNAESALREARRKNDFGIFEYELSKVVDYFKSFAEYWGYENNPYDALLNYNFAGLTSEKLDEYINLMKPIVTQKLAETASDKKKSKADNSGRQIDTRLSVAEQKVLWQKIGEKLGFDFSKGRVDEGYYSTILNNSPDDIRIIIKPEEGNFLVGILDVAHSFGKGIYHQNISKKLKGTLLLEAPNFPWEEAIGRFYESLIRHRGFWESLMEDQAVKEKLLNVTAGEMVDLVNRVTPSETRALSDELTEFLHIIIRYEIEKELLNGNIEVEDLPKIWDEKYLKYLGISPTSDKEGILQDIHWATGYIGYFPTYIISSICYTQIYCSVEEELGSVDEILRRDEISTINDWLTEKIFKFGASYSVDFLLKNATGEGVNPECYCQVMNNRY